MKRYSVISNQLSVVLSQERDLIIRHETDHRLPITDYFKIE
jgi:hypothetical protein